MRSVNDTNARQDRYKNHKLRIHDGCRYRFFCFDLILSYTVDCLILLLSVSCLLLCVFLFVYAFDSNVCRMKCEPSTSIKFMRMLIENANPWGRATCNSCDSKEYPFQRSQNENSGFPIKSCKSTNATPLSLRTFSSLSCLEKLLLFAHVGKGYFDWIDHMHCVLPCVINYSNEAE